MIKLNRNELCCGCGACAEVCAHNAITMQADAEGFFYPVTDVSLCSECGLCDKVCPFINREKGRMPKGVYAVRNRDISTRLKSSSGGVFSLLAEQTIKEGGVVFGAKFDSDWSVVHAAAKSVQECEAFVGSKYVQSRLGSTHSEVRRYLKEGRKVLFSGTPCQVASLRKFLRKEYDNLLLVEVVCHGAPSNKVWQHYLDKVVAETKHSRNDILSISFRDKRNGWNNYGVCIKFEDGSEWFEPMVENAFMHAFLKDLSIRPSCFECACRNGCSGADLSLADFWGLRHVMKGEDDDKGTSLELVWSKKGAEATSGLSVDSKSASYYKAFKFNPAIVLSPKRPDLREEFWRIFNSEGLDKALEVTPHMKWRRAQKWLYSLKYNYTKNRLKFTYNEDRNCNSTPAK